VFRKPLKDLAVTSLKHGIRGIENPMTDIPEVSNIAVDSLRSERGRTCQSQVFKAESSEASIVLLNRATCSTSVLGKQRMNNLQDGDDDGRKKRANDGKPVGVPLNRALSGP
jgi:hypothetical protein